MYGFGFLSRGFTDRREILHGGSAWSQTGHRLFWGRLPQGWPSFGRQQGPYGGICFLLKHLLWSGCAGCELQSCRHVRVYGSVQVSVQCSWYLWHYRQTATYDARNPSWSRPAVCILAQVYTSYSDRHSQCCFSYSSCPLIGVIIYIQYHIQGVLGVQHPGLQFFGARNW